MSKKGFKIVVNPDPARVTYKRGKKATEEIAEQLKKDKRIFIAGIDRRSVWYYTRRFETLTGKKVVAEQAGFDGEEGYEFKVKK